MPSNSCGQLFRMTTWGESHGPAVGVVIDGVPAGMALDVTSIQRAVDQRAPGKNEYTTPRREPDAVEILSGVFEGQTTGAPLSIIIWNKDADSSQYQAIKNQLRPGHANYTYIEKYGVFDYRGGGRASARETVCRVAAGAVAAQLLQHYHVDVCAYVAAIGPISLPGLPTDDLVALRQAVLDSPIYCPDVATSEAMQAALAEQSAAGDSLGGVVAVITSALPVGWGDPVYEKLEANLAKAMMSIPATKGFELGEGFAAAAMTGSQHNDGYVLKQGEVALTSQHAGGTLGGISCGTPLSLRVAFKPTSSIKKSQQSVDITTQKNVDFQLPKTGRHDPCVAIRAVPVVEAMVALVLADALLAQRLTTL